MSIDPANHNWDRQLETRLPDCRLKPLEREKARYHHGRLVLDQVFCATCFAPFGGVTPNVPHIFYICDNCVRTNGPPPECVEVKFEKA